MLFVHVNGYPKTTFHYYCNLFWMYHYIDWTMCQVSDRGILTKARLGQLSNHPGVPSFASWRCPA